MKHFNLIRSLFLGVVSVGLLVNSVSGQALSYPRLDEVPVSVLKEGCFPLVNQMCPSLYICMVDIKYPKFGQCICQPTYGLQLKPPTPVEPGSEIANLPHKSDCEPIGAINFFLALYNFFIGMICLVITCGSFSILRVLIQKKVFKSNSSCIALIGNFLCALGSAIRSFIYMLYPVGWDRDEFFRTTVYYPFDTLAAAALLLMMFESTCTWFDLWQKSIKMSKTSSKTITVFRNFLRLYGVLNVAMFICASYGLVPGNTVALFRAAQNTGQYGLFAMNAVIAPLLSRVLCKNMKDVTNPNWKAASAIRITATHGAVIAIAFNIGFQLILNFGLFTFQAQHMNYSFIQMMFLYSAVNLWAWYQYLQFAHRRHLGDVASTRISDYFGFTTLGLKGSRASSVASQRSSIASSSASSAPSLVSSTSVAASSSVEEGGGSGETDAKGTIA